jgi:hypothetical protein
MDLTLEQAVNALMWAFLTVPFALGYLCGRHR